MKYEEIVSKTEELFGYPLPEGVASLLDSTIADREPDDVWQYACDFLITPNIVWEFDGPKDLTELADPDPEPEASLLAFQLIGYFAPKYNPFFAGRAPEDLRIDVAPGHDHTVMLAGGRFAPYVGPILDSFSKAVEAQSALFELEEAQVADSPAEERARQKSAANFVAAYPALAELFWDKIEELGAPATIRPTHARDAFQAPTPLFHTALSVAECLLGREKRVVVHPAFAVVDRNDAASLTVGMLVKFAADQKGGLVLAKEVLQGGLGVPLTQRWAQRLVDGYPAAMRLMC